MSLWIQRIHIAFRRETWSELESIPPMHIAATSLEGWHVVEARSWFMAEYTPLCILKRQRKSALRMPLYRVMVTWSGPGYWRTAGTRVRALFMLAVALRLRTSLRRAGNWFLR